MPDSVTGGFGPVDGVADDATAMLGAAGAAAAAAAVGGVRGIVEACHALLILIFESENLRDVLFK